MQTYLVGGAVRDQLLDRPVKERDWVVVGATPQDMLDAGYRPVGRDFPVFLHPETNEEYALARTERKSGPGHQGFVVHASPDVTLEEDLRRRDLTINAIAQDEDGTLIDPYGGQDDIREMTLRHVSEAFAEDPLRILRIARFKATFPSFSIHHDTQVLLDMMVADGALDELTPERVLLELDKALAAQRPAVFFEVLGTLNANRILWPELDEDAFERLDGLASTDVETRFAVLFDGTSEESVRSFCQRYRTSNQRQDVTLLLVRHKATWLALDQLGAQDVVDLLYAVDAFRKQARFIAFDRVCSDITGVQSRWPRLLELAAGVTASDIDNALSGPELGAAIRAERTRVIKEQLS